VQRGFLLPSLPIVAQNPGSHSRRREQTFASHPLLLDCVRKNHSHSAAMPRARSREHIRRPQFVDVADAFLPVDRGSPMWQRNARRTISANYCIHRLNPHQKAAFRVEVSIGMNAPCPWMTEVPVRRMVFVGAFGYLDFMSLTISLGRQPC
jgi:hypothetical protein